MYLTHLVNELTTTMKNDRDSGVYTEFLKGRIPVPSSLTSVLTRRLFSPERSLVTRRSVVMAVTLSSSGALNPYFAVSDLSRPLRLVDVAARFILDLPQSTIQNVESPQTSCRHSSVLTYENSRWSNIHHHCRHVIMSFNVCPLLRPSCDAVVSCVYGSVDQHERFTVMYICFIYTETFTRIGL